MLKTEVILTNVTNLSDARYASGMGVDFIGFMVNPDHEQFVTAQEVKMITEWLSGVKIIGDVEANGNTNLDDYSLDIVQTSDFSVIDNFKTTIATISLTTGNYVEINEVLGKMKENIEFFVLKVTKDDLSSLKFELKNLCNSFSIFISTEFDNDSLEIVLTDIKPQGIVIYGSKEEKPGLSSYDGIADILEQLEVD